MSVKSRESGDYVSYADVFHWCDELERAWHCGVHYEWFTNQHRDGRKVWSIRITAVWPGIGKEVRRERGVSIHWPHPDHKTPPGAMIRLAHELDALLQKEEDEKAKATQRRLPFGQH